MRRISFLIFLCSAGTSSNAGGSNKRGVRSLKNSNGKKVHGKKDSDGSKGKKSSNESGDATSRDGGWQEHDYDSDDLRNTPAPTCIECDDIIQSLQRESDHNEIEIDQSISSTIPSADDVSVTIPKSADKNTEGDDVDKKTVTNIFNPGNEEPGTSVTVIETASRNSPVANYEIVGDGSVGGEIADIAKDATSSSYYREGANLAVCVILSTTVYFCLSIHWL